jgi:hypothetical protein
LISCGPLVALSPVAVGVWFPYSGSEQFRGEFVNLSELRRDHLSSRQCRSGLGIIFNHPYPASQSSSRRSRFEARKESAKKRLKNAYTAVHCKTNNSSVGMVSSPAKGYFVVTAEFVSRIAFTSRIPGH